MKHITLLQKAACLVTFAIAMVASTTTAAEIVYTPINVVLTGGQSYKLDLNNDGTVDFVVKATRSMDSHCHGVNASLRITPTLGNGVEGAPTAAAVPTGSLIGTGLTFKTTGHPLIESVRYGDFLVCGSTRCRCYFENISQGSWLNVSAYLGLEFQTNGQTHYGGHS